MQPAVQNSQEVFGKKNLAAWLLAAAGLIAVVVVPRLFAGSSSTGPGIAVTGLTSLVLIFIMAMVANYVIKNAGLSQTKRFLVFFVIYNALIIFVKFALGPMAFYSDKSGVYNASSFSIGSMQGIIIWVAVSMFALYALAYTIVYRHYKAIAKTQIEPPSQNRAKPLKRSSKVMAAAIIIAALILSGGAPIFIMIFLLGDPLQYLGYVFSGFYGTMVSILLAGGTFLLARSFEDVQAQAVSMRNLAILSSVFWLGLSFIAVYHVLWVVYMLILLNIWPLKVVVPK